MKTLGPYVAGAMIAILSQGILALAAGQPEFLRSDPVAAAFASIAAPPAVTAAPGAAGPAPAAFVQDVNRAQKGDRLIPKHSDDPMVASSGRGPVKPAGTPKKPGVTPSLPEGCTSSVSILSDRLAASQASNCITALEVPWKVAAAEPADLAP